MAIIQSILVGKGKGKIGNVVLSGLKGQTVAKQLNSSPSNPRTVAQTANRVKMANAVLAWQYLSIFMSNAKGLRKPLESVYNAFVRTVVSDMGSVLADSRAVSAVIALRLKAFAGNWLSTSITDMSKSSIVVGISASGFSWLPTYRLSAVAINISTGEQSVIDVALLETDFNNGSTIVTIPTSLDATVGAVYIYDSASSKISNIAFVEQ